MTFLQVLLVVLQRREETLQSCDRRMLCYMAGASLSDRVASKEEPRRCSVKPLLPVVREKRLIWKDIERNSFPATIYLVF